MNNATPGWYPPDPSKPSELRYWDGAAWTEHNHTVAAASVPSARAWYKSKAAIVSAAVMVAVMAVYIGTATNSDTSTDTRAQGGDVSLTSVTPTPTMTPTWSAPSAPPSAEPTTSAAPSPSVTAPAATPSASPSATQPEPAATTGTARAAALKLPVKGRAPKTGYTRDQFGNAWVDVDRNGCDTRNDELKLRLTHKKMSGTCKVLAGDLDDPYTGKNIHFEYGGASEVDIDHMVALSDAWQKGAAKWEFAKRVAFANDPLNVEPVDASSNRKKSDGDAATWLPPNKSWRCEYVARQIAVKTKYGVWVTQAEQDAMVKVLTACPGQALPAFGSQPVIAENTGGSAPKQTTKPTAKPKTTTKPAAPSGKLDPDYGTCKEAIAHGAGPYYEGKDEEYGWYRDQDKDGVVCE